MNILGLTRQFLRVASVQQTTVRYMRKKHRDPKWRRLRGEKVIKVSFSKVTLHFCCYKGSCDFLFRRSNCQTMTKYAARTPAR